MAPKSKQKKDPPKPYTQISKQEQRQAPNWPTLRPLVPSSDLSLTPIVPSQILTISNFWTSSLCKTYVSFLATLPLTTTPGKPKRGEAVRVNDRYQIDDAVFAERLWSQTALKGLVTGEAAGATDAERKALWGGDVVGVNPNIRVYRYGKGQFFDQHYDDSNNVKLPGTPAILGKTTWTLLLYLTSSATGCVGGETVFYPPKPASKDSKKESLDPVVVSLEVGMALLHKHGADCMLHEGKTVIEGEKWVLRSDICVRR